MVELFKEIITNFHLEWKVPGLVQRQLKVPCHSGKIISLMGPRRTGKTCYLMQLIGKMREQIGIKKIVYVNFEDERLSMDASGFQSLLDAYQQLYPEIKLQEVYWFFDEIQEIKDWEKFVRRVHDSISQNIFLTGSSAKMLGKEIAASIRGRTLAYTLLPLNFSEYLIFKGEKLLESHIYSSRKKNRLITLFNEFLKYGGYPETVSQDPELRQRTLQSYLDIMIYRDVIERYSIKNTVVTKELLKRLIRNSAQIFSVNKYYNELKSRNISVGKDILYHLVDHFEEAFAIGTLPKWDESIIKQQQAQKKIYAIDNGLVSASKFIHMEDLGFFLEAAVYQELIKYEFQSCYFQNGVECDFLATKSENMEIIQVCYELDSQNTKREVQGIVSACKRLNKSSGIILTHSQEQTIESNSISIKVIPAWKWALQLNLL